MVIEKTLLAAAAPPPAGSSLFVDLSPAGFPTGGLDVIAKFIVSIISLALVVGGLLAVIFIILGGIRWITSGGDPKALSSAKSSVASAVIGLILVFVSFALVRLLQTFFNTNLGLP